MGIKEHFYFRSQKVTISGAHNYIKRSNSLNTYDTSSSINKHNTGDPSKEKMAGALEEKVVKKKRGGRETKEKDIMKRRQEGGEDGDKEER